PGTVFPCIEKPGDVLRSHIKNILLCTDSFQRADCCISHIKSVHSTFYLIDLIHCHDPPSNLFLLCKRRAAWFWADCRLVISIVLCLPVFIPDFPWHGNTPDGHGFGLIGISPPRGSH